MTNKRAFVTAHQAQHAVSTLCRLLEISRGWFYGFLTSQPARDQRHSDREARDLALLPKIRIFSAPAKSVTAPSASTNTFWPMVKWFLNVVWLG